MLVEIAEYLRANYTNYGRAIGYLEQLAGVRAMPRKKACQLQFLCMPQASVQRGAVILGNPELHTLHSMQVRFHRYH